MDYYYFGSIYGNFAISKIKNINEVQKVYKVKYNQWLDTKYWKLQDEKTAKRIKKEFANINK